MLLAEGLQRLKKTQQAAKVWLQAADICSEKRLFDQLLICYRSALECGVNDPEMVQKIAKADEDEKKTHLRLHTLDWAVPKSTEFPVIVKAEILFEYGLFDYALKVLKDLPHRSVSGSVLKAEIAFAKGDNNTGVDQIQNLENLSQQAQIDIQTRLTVLGLLTDDDEVLDDLIDDDLMDDDLMDDDLGDDDLGDDDLGDDDLGSDANPVDALIIEAESLASEGRSEEAIDIYTRILDLDPENEHALMRIPDLMSAQDDTFTPVEEEGDFTDIDPEQFSFAEPTFEPEVTFSQPTPSTIPSSHSISSSLDDGSLAQARAYLMVGMSNKVKSLLQECTDVPSQAVLGAAYLQLGDLRSARNTLEDALEEVVEGSLDHLEILWSLGTVFTQQEKSRSALRILDEINSLQPDWRARDILAWKKGLELLRG
jgi:tetratricopeptide (TPR) repeat protein